MGRDLERLIQKKDDAHYGMISTRERTCENGEPSERRRCQQNAH